MVFIKGQTVRNINEPLQKYIIDRENAFKLDGVIKVRSLSGPLYQEGQYILFVPHNPEIHEKSLDGTAKYCVDCQLELDE